MAPYDRNSGSNKTGQAALPHKNIQSAKMDSLKHEQKELEQGKKSTDIIMNQEQDDKSKDKKKERE